ncbi:MAG: response regulator transcription factor [Streptosporangiales bacterium]|nr:response regulator transcription factor [Streptosporangiales bacterium]MBO0891066.1 response regulator transcription factor [Acidothermales bacterium]
MNRNTGRPGRILVVDDDPTVAEVVTRYLEHDGHTVDRARDGASALRQAAARRPDLVVLDLMLPGIDGYEVCRRLRATTSGGDCGGGGMSSVPIVMLTARGDETDRVTGLELGADDYVTKPFSPRELALRVQSVLRRSRATTVPAPGELLRDGDLTVDVGAHEARLGGELLSLTVREFELLVHLLRHPRQAFTRAELLDRVWGWSFGDHSTVTVHVRRLREKIEARPTEPVRIVTVWGVGYRYEPAGSDVAEDS